MPAVLDPQGWPTCCGYPLQPDGQPVICGFCNKAYDIDGLRRLMLEHRGGSAATNVNLDRSVSEEK